MTKSIREDESWESCLSCFFFPSFQDMESIKYFYANSGRRHYKRRLKKDPEIKMISFFISSQNWAGLSSWHCLYKFNWNRLSTVLKGSYLHVSTASVYTVQYSTWYSWSQNIWQVWNIKRIKKEKFKRHDNKRRRRYFDTNGQEEICLGDRNIIQAKNKSKEHLLVVGELRSFFVPANAAARRSTMHSTGIFAT